MDSDDLLPNREWKDWDAVAQDLGVEAKCVPKIQAFSENFKQAFHLVCQRNEPPQDAAQDAAEVLRNVFCVTKGG